MVGRMTGGKRLPRRGAAGGREQNRRCAAVRRRIDQSGHGIGTAAGAGWTLRTDEPAKRAGDSVVAKRLVDGPARQVGRGQGSRATCGYPRARLFLRIIAGGRVDRCDDSPAALDQLVESEIVHQRGLLPQARYIFRHALIQDAAYQSLLRSTRQQYHKHIAQTLAERFPEIKETQPELLARHYTEAGLVAQAIPYWLQAGQQAGRRSAHVEAISHLTRGLELLSTLPDGLARAQQELALQVAMAASLLATKGFAAPEPGDAYQRALALCHQIGETPQLFPVLAGLRFFYTVAGELRTGCEIGEQLLRLAESTGDPGLTLEAHYGLGSALFYLGELDSAGAHFEKSIALYDSGQQRRFLSGIGMEAGVASRCMEAWVLWPLGYPDRALEREPGGAEPGEGSIPSVQLGICPDVY